MSIRVLDLGSAWNEAERRAIPFLFVGFFLAGLISDFGYHPGIKEPFLAGICGAIGLFLAQITFLIGFHHKKTLLAAVAALLIATCPTVITALLLPWTESGRAAFAPSIVAGISLYFVMHRVHRRLSGLALVTYVNQLADDEHEDPKPGWQQTLFWLFVGIGALVILALLTTK